LQYSAYPIRKEWFCWSI